MRKERPLVSIWCITYNHGNYIKDAIESFLMQETDFEYEIIIHDDASTDGADEIIRQYVEKNPGKIKTVIQPRNLYSCLSMKDFYLTVSSALEEKTSGKYVAWCEGDDFWIDNHKLQLQVDYMESHPDCSMTAHNDVVIDMSSGSTIRARNPYDCDKDISIEELIVQYHGNIPTASIVARRDCAVPKGFFAGTMPSGDRALQLYCATKGKIHYFDRIMACYRVFVPNSFSSDYWEKESIRYGAWIDQIYFFRLFDEYTKGVHREPVSRRMYELINSLFVEHANKDIEQFERMCNERGKGKNEDYHKLLTQLIEAFYMFKDENFCTECIKEFTQKHEHVLIMGAGLWGKKMANQLVNNRLPFDGYVVSNGHKQQEKETDKELWELNGIPFDKGTYGIIVAVSFPYYFEVIKNLQKCGIEEYIYLFEMFDN